MLTVNRASLDEKPVLENLMELYIYDLSKIVPNREFFLLNDEGRFGYPRFDRFWQDPGCNAYLFRYDGKLAGFSLTHSSPFFNKDKDGRVIGEFFILYPYREKGLGVQAATKVMQFEPGFWEMRVINDNKVAVNFWEKVLQTATDDDYIIHEKNDFEWIGKVFVGNVN